MQPAPVGDYVEAFSRMRSGALLMIIGALLAGLGLLMLFPLTMVAGFGFGPGGPFGREPDLGAVLASLLAVLVLILIGAVISLVGMYAKFIPGTSRLAQINPEFSTASTLIKIGYLVGLILMIIGALTLIILVGFFLIVIAAIFMFIGAIGLIILCFKLNDLEKNSLYLVAGILFIIGIFIGIASFIAWILMYVALGHSISKRAAPPTPGPAVAQPL